MSCSSSLLAGLGALEGDVWGGDHCQEHDPGWEGQTVAAYAPVEAVHPLSQPATIWEEPCTKG